MITGHTPPFDSVDQRPRHPCANLPGLQRVVHTQHHNTYLHAGPRPGVGWPVDHKAEDTFELPPTQSGLPELQARERAQSAAAKITAKVEGANWHLDVLSPAPDAPLKRYEWTEDRVVTIAPKLNVLDHPELLCPPTPAIFDAAEEYRAEYTSGGGVVLVLLKTSIDKTTIATFNNHADAVTAAKALNELKGY